MKSNNLSVNVTSRETAFLNGGGEMGERIRTFDWSKTSLGPILDWPSYLKNAVSLSLQSVVPMALLWGKEGIMLYNDGYAEFSMGKHPSILGQPVMEAWPETEELINEYMGKGFRGESLSYQGLHLVLYRNQVPEDAWVDVNYSPVMNEKGEPAGVFAIVIETTQQVLAEQKRKQAEESLRDSEERLRLALEGTRDGLWDWDFKNDKAWWDERYTEISGIDIPIDERSLHSMSRFIHPDDLHVVTDALKAHLERGEKFEFEYRTVPPLGEIRYIAAKGKAVLDEKGNVQRLTGTITDITERKKNEEISRRLTESLQLANKLLSGITEGTSDMIAAIDMDYRYIAFNQTYQKEVKDIFGSHIELGMTVMETLAHLPQEKAKALATWDRALAGERYTTIEAFGDLKRKYYELSYTPLVNEQGEVIGASHIVRDTTERKLAELHLQEHKDRLEYSNRELEQFATIASHDLRAPLRKIATFTGALEQLEGANLSREGKDYLQRIHKSAEKMQSFVTNLLTLSSITRQDKPFKTVPLRNVLAEVLADLEPLRKEVQGKIELGDLCILNGDESQLYQLFQNLIGNALKFHRKDTSPIIKVNSEMLANGYCQITVQDNGIGFKMEQAERIFEPFQRLNSQQDYDGTGMGLAVVKRIVERHNGIVTVASVIGEGTTFIITLPMKQA